MVKETKKYWIEMLQAYFSADTEDRKVVLDDYDLADYLQMAVETTVIDVMNRKYQGVTIADMAVEYKDLPVVDGAVLLKTEPGLQDTGIISAISSNGDILVPRKKGVESAVYKRLKPQSMVPTYEIYGNRMDFEYKPAFNSVTVYMIPKITELDDEDEYRLNAGVKDIVFTRVRAISIDKLKFKPDYKNNTNANSGQV